MFAMTIGFTMLTETIERILNTDAPSTFLTPNSLVLFSIENDTKPNNPIHAIKIVSILKIRNTFPNLCSEEYSALRLSSRKLYSNGVSGAIIFHFDSKYLITFDRSFPFILITIKESGIL